MPKDSLVSILMKSIQRMQQHCNRHATTLYINAIIYPEMYILLEYSEVGHKANCLLKYHILIESSFIDPCVFKEADVSIEEYIIYRGVITMPHIRVITP